jgi:hypothetical protein
MTKPPLVALLAAAALTTQASAGDLRVNGHLTVAATGSSDGGLRFARDLTRVENVDDEIRADIDSILGLQIGGSVGEGLDWIVQGVLRDRAEQSLDESIEWAFLRYQPQDSLTLRLGRLGFDVFMLSDYRDVGYANHFVRPPVSFYGFLPVFRVDGADLRASFELGPGEVDVKTFVGRSESTIEFVTGVSDDSTFTLEIDQVWGASLEYRLGDWRLRASYNQGDFGSNPPVEPVYDALDQAAPLWPDARYWRSKLSLDGATVRYTNLGLGYDDGRWLLVTELARVDSDSYISPRLWAAYASAGHRFGDFTLFATLDGNRPIDPRPDVSLPDALPPPLAAQLDPLRIAVQDAAELSLSDQTGLALGLRWDAAPRLALKAQWNHWRVESDATLLWGSSVPGDAGTRGVSVYSLALNWLF